MKEIKAESDGEKIPNKGRTSGRNYYSESGKQRKRKIDVKNRKHRILKEPDEEGKSFSQDENKKALL
ncbi:hypothetical protein NQ317_015526 [Molorchus minor]|uniref:Uncharacterized protein n=1 Tax=Molorchus minor TaxID=1323400 RepID=A0ABQ9JKT3_9CUCU|nr:hypothetical protein NQ317_015526 [Molorchus minor]